MIKTQFERGAGILCHVSSLPNKYGIGSLGREAYEFVDILAYCGVKYWQILPLVQTGYGDSPYQSVCCNSGNPYFIDLVSLRDMWLLTDEELASAEREGEGVDYGSLYNDRYAILRAAYARFDKNTPDYVAFIESGEFHDYAMYMSLKNEYKGGFADFPEEYKKRDKEALDRLYEGIKDGEYGFWQFVQFIFFKQWQDLRAYANSKGIKLIGDLPLYVACDSSDVWAMPELFQLDSELKPEAVAGVPPDYFSEDGQLWGNPLYNWEYMQQTGFEWWISRIERAKRLYDIVRIDHFRGLDRYCSIPADHENARKGVWVKALGLEMLQAAENRLGALPVIAEDLGIIDDGVIKLLNESGFPGMKILQFAFDGDSKNAYLPKNIGKNSVTYTGTHDNDTMLGYILNLDADERKKFIARLRKSLREEGLKFPIVEAHDCVNALNLLALSTCSDIAILPIQDWLCLDGDARMNTPSYASGNWQFRLSAFPTLRQKTTLKRYIKKTDR